MAYMANIIQKLKKELKHEKQLVKVLRERFGNIKQPLLNKDQLYTMIDNFIGWSQKDYRGKIFTSLEFYNDYLKGNVKFKYKKQ